MSLKQKRPGNKAVRVDLTAMQTARRLQQGTAPTTVYFSVKGVQKEVQSQAEISIVEGLFCDDGTFIAPGHPCPEDKTEIEITNSLNPLKKAKTSTITYCKQGRTRAIQTNARP
ncbi:MAG: hypothetical protein V2I33_16545 [Kangiellaceae bacterium]|jgi:hypothetical protein|nr:hypothetical protein [Kangiellaceae bacterium]